MDQTSVSYLSKQQSSQISNFSVKLLSILSSAGGDIDRRTSQERDWKTPLLYAADFVDYDVITHLVLSGANVTAVDKEGNSILHYLARRLRV